MLALHNFTAMMPFTSTKLYYKQVLTDILISDPPTILIYVYLRSKFLVLWDKEFNYIILLQV